MLQNKSDFDSTQQIAELCAFLPNANTLICKGEISFQKSLA